MGLLNEEAGSLSVYWKGTQVSHATEHLEQRTPHNRAYRNQN